MMLPSRGAAKNPASVLRYSLSSRTKPTRIASTRQFSQAQSQPSLLSRHGLLHANTPQFGQRISSGAVVGITAGVFAQRSGASRNLSLWPFGSKTQTPPSTETLEAPLAAPPVEAQPLSTPAEVATEAAVPPPTPSPVTDEVSLNELPDHLLRQLDSESLLDIPERIGYLRELGLDYGWGTTSACQWLLEHIHVYSGMPWWGSLAAFALVFRAIIFYPALVGSKHQAMIQKAQGSQAYITAKARFDEALHSNDRSALMYARAEMSRVLKSSGASWWRSSIQMLMIPFSFGMFRLLQGMAGIPVPGLEVGGMGWFTDLTVRDPFFILPAIAVGLTFLIFKQSRRIARASPSHTEMQEKVSKFAMMMLPPVMFLTTMWFPAGLQWVMLCTSLGALIQTQTTLSTTVRRWMGLSPISDAPSRNNGIIKGTSYEIKYESPTKASLTDSLKNGVEAATSALKQATGSTPERAEKERAKKYEDRRAEEERASVERRMEELRRRRSGRRS